MTLTSGEVIINHGGRVCPTNDRDPGYPPGSFCVWGLVMSRHSDRSWDYRVKRERFLRDHTVCWLCGHDGANQVDHVAPRSRLQEPRVDVTNWRPAHGPPGCPTCGRNCNQKRGNRAPRPYLAAPASFPVRAW